MAQKKTVQLNVAQPVDSTFYSQWERKTATRGSGGGVVSGASVRTPSTPTSGASALRKLNREQIRPSKYGMITSAEEEKAERMKLLEMKIMSTRAAINNYKERERTLITKNLAMKEAIQATEKPNHESVKKLMRRYEKFRGGISFLNDNFTTTLQTENSSLHDLQQRLDRELDVIQQEVNNLDRKLHAKQTQVYILNNYKDKEYPVKAIRIGELMTELDKVEMENDDEYYDLERVINNELEKLAVKGKDTEVGIKESALNDVLQQMHPSLREMAKQNQVMESEIVYHQGQIIKLQEDLQQLEGNVRQLLEHPKTNVRLQVFPELFKYDTKCTPDMDVVLDIPKVQILPI